MTGGVKTPKNLIVKEVLDKAVDLMDAIDGAGGLRVGSNKTNTQKTAKAAAKNTSDGKTGNKQSNAKDKE